MYWRDEWQVYVCVNGMGENDYEKGEGEGEGISEEKKGGK